MSCITTIHDSDNTESDRFYASSFRFLKKFRTSSLVVVVKLL